MTTRESAVKEKDKQLNIESITSNDLTWIYIERPTEQETAYLAQHFPIFHPLNLDDILSRIQRPKIDEYKDHLFIVLHFPFFKQEEWGIISSELDVFIGENYLITVDCSGNLKTLSKFFKFCETNDEAKLENFSRGSGYLLYRIIDQLVDYCFPILNRISADIEETEDNIFARKSVPRAIEDISVLRREVISFRRIIWPMRAVIASLEPKIRRFTKTDLTDYFGDTIDHVDKIWDALDEYKEVIEGLNATHDSLVTNRTNQVIRMLTIIATILAPITVVASIFGMNIPLGPFGSSHYSALYVFFICLAIIGSMLYVFRRRRWI
jgi:magnesium transporter